MDYFPHDTMALSDDKLLALRIDDGLEAVACYWAVLEKIYADEKPFDVSETNVGSSAEARSVSYKLGVGFDTMRKYVFDMERVGLLYRVEDGADVFMSERAAEQIELLDKKRETARQNGKSGGRKPKDNQRRKPTETNVGSSRKPNSDTYKTLNGIGSYKKEPIPVASTSGGAVAEESAPPSAPDCPLCGVPLRKTGMADEPWWCDNCTTGFKADKVVA